MRNFIISSLFRIYVNIIALVITIRTLVKQRNTEKRLLFINYRAFGHSIFDSYCVYEYYKNLSLVISIGENHERNSTFTRMVPCNSLLQVILPSWHRRFGAGNHLLIRKFVGPQIEKFLLFSQKIGILDKHLLISGNNRNVINQTARLVLENRLGWSSRAISNLFFYLTAQLEKSGSLKFVNEGSLILVALLERIKNADSLFKPQEIEEFKTSLRIKTNTPDKVEFRLFVVIISNRSKPWNGSGLNYYLPTIEKLLELPQAVVICLGDSSSQIAQLRNSGAKYLRLLSDDDLGSNRQLSQFLAILLAELCIGDGSGIWSIFSLLGKKGIRCNVIPGAKLYNRCITIPRPWRNSTGKEASVNFYERHLQYSFVESRIDDDLWAPFLINCSEIADIIHQLLVSELDEAKLHSSIFSNNLLHCFVKQLKSSGYFAPHIPRTGM